MEPTAGQTPEVYLEDDDEVEIRFPSPESQTATENHDDSSSFVPTHDSWTCEKVTEEIQDDGRDETKEGEPSTLRPNDGVIPEPQAAPTAMPTSNTDENTPQAPTPPPSIDFVITNTDWTIDEAVELFPDLVELRNGIAQKKKAVAARNKRNEEQRKVSNSTKQTLAVS